jgi:hypothetical protein
MNTLEDCGVYTSKRGNTRVYVNNQLELSLIEIGLRFPQHIRIIVAGKSSR